MIYYKNIGWDKTIYNFYELVRETKNFNVFKHIGKKHHNGQVFPDRTQIGQDEFKLSKESKKLHKWNGEEMIENNNYTYTGA